jgi:tocopherol O-methyltransferase
MIWEVHKNYSLHFGFHEKNHMRHNDAVVNANRVLAEIARIRAGDRILDAGCGWGGSSVWLARERGADVVGIDLNPTHVKIARELASRTQDKTRIEFSVDDFSKTKFADDSFDVVWGLESICYAKSKEKFIMEAERLLKRGGRLIIADGFLTRDDFSQTEAKVLRSWLEGWAVPNLVSVRSFRGYLEKVGLDNIQFKDITRNVMMSSNRLYFSAIYGGFLSEKLLELARVAKPVHMKNVLAAWYQHVALKKGLWSYGIFYGQKK